MDKFGNVWVWNAGNLIPGIANGDRFLELTEYVSHPVSGSARSIERNLIKMVAVGMLVSQHPPHRSVHEVLPHTAPALGHDGKPLIRPWM